jgi:uncharacterized protein involved in cysteine biosynthesis
MRFSALDAIASVLTGVGLIVGDRGVRRSFLAVFLVLGVSFVLTLAALLIAVFWATSGLIDGSATGAALGWGLRLVLLVITYLYSPVLLVVLTAAVVPAAADSLYRASQAGAGGPPLPREGAALSVGLLFREVRFAGRIALGSLAILLFHLIPGIGSALAVLAQVLLTSAAMGRELLTYHFDAWDTPGPERAAFLSNNRAGTIVLGAAAALATWIPIVQVLGSAAVISIAGAASARISSRLQR